MRVDEVENVEPPPIARQFGERVRDLRQANGWTQGDLAKRLVAAGHKLHQSTVARMEVGERPTSVDEVASLARIFGVSIASLFEPPEQLRVLFRWLRVKQRIDEVDDELDGLGEQADRLTAEREELAREYAELDARLERARLERRDPSEVPPF